MASKLGISRQSVSKWERAEASPDTDNLICLAKIYGVSLDELLSNDQSVEEIAEEVKETTTSKECDTVTITDDEGQSIKIKDGHIKFEKEDGTEEEKSLGLIICDTIVLALTLTGYFVWSFVFDAWEVSWVVWVLMPAVMSIFEAIAKRKIAKFVYPCLVTAVYLFLGMQFDLWHPYWFLFITIPFFYIIADNVDKIVAKKKEMKENKAE